jgi:hypothetical protein
MQSRALLFVLPTQSLDSRCAPKIGGLNPASVNEGYKKEFNDIEMHSFGKCSK